MDYLLDTNILLRCVDAQAAEHALASRVVARMPLDGHRPCITAQNLIEFWAVATRPVEANGLGWEISRARLEMEQLRNSFPLLQENPHVLEEWLGLIHSLAIIGKRTHDARLVAVMRSYNISNVLTFNVSHFASFQGVLAVSPRDYSR